MNRNVNADSAWCASRSVPYCCALAARALEAVAEQPDLSDLSIEQLAQIKVTSASKTEEPLSEAPAALYVITGQGHRGFGRHLATRGRFGSRPNLNVQQVTTSQYAIAARGFNGVQAGNKLLVLIDGRSIYTPLARQCDLGASPAAA